MIRNRLTKWKSVISTLENPKNRPNDFQQLILDCHKNGLTVRDAHRIFGVSHRFINDLKNKFTEQRNLDDKRYFMLRARKLGADDEAIAQWFGYDRADQVSMELAKLED